MVFFYGFVPVYGKLREFRLRVMHEYLIRSRLRENYPDREQSGAAKAGSRGTPGHREGTGQDLCPGGSGFPGRNAAGYAGCPGLDQGKPAAQYLLLPGDEPG